MTSTAVDRVEAADLEHRKHLNRVITTADVIAKSGLLRADLTPEDARAIAITLDQMGVPPGLLNINAGYVVKGKVDFMTRIWAALGARAGYRVWPDDASSAEVGIVHISGGPFGINETVTFSWEDATKAGLTGSDTYKKYGRDMLIWRAMKRALGWHAPEVVAGMGEPLPDVVSHPRPRSIPDNPEFDVDQDDDTVDAELVEPPAHETADEQDAVYALRRRRANAVMGEIGVKDDDDRHDLVGDATHGATRSTGKLTHEQVVSIVAYCDRMKAIASKMSTGAGSETAPAGPIAADSADPDNAGEGSVVGSPAVPGPVDWRGLAAEQGIAPGRLLRMARDFAAARGLTQPSTIDEVTDELVIADVVAALEGDA